MSRVTEYDSWDENAEALANLWEINTTRTVNSARGQAMLREIEAALLALPQHELAYETFCRVEESDDVPEGIVVQACVLGAVTWHRGLAGKVPRAFNPTQKQRDEYGLDVDADEEAAWAAGHLKMAFTLAWNLIERNDDEYERCTPAERWEKMLAWVRLMLTPVEA